MRPGAPLDTVVREGFSEEATCKLEEVTTEEKPAV